LVLPEYGLASEAGEVACGVLSLAERLCEVFPRRRDLSEEAGQDRRRNRGGSVPSFRENETPRVRLILLEVEVSVSTQRCEAQRKIFIESGSCCFLEDPPDPSTSFREEPAPIFWPSPQTYIRGPSCGAPDSPSLPLGKARSNERRRVRYPKIQPPNAGHNERNRGTNETVHEPRGRTRSDRLRLWFRR
jgi:hypothetical protein